MTQFKDIYAGRKPALSVEIFPPKTEQSWANLQTELTHLVAHRPAFVSVTYGAGGSTRAKTLELVEMIHTRFQVMSVPHFTCVGSSRDDVRDYVDRVLAQGVRNLVALRGDPPQGDAQFAPVPDGFRYANDLVAFIKGYTAELDIAVAGYPEGHVECRHLVQDVENLKRKVDAGASVVLTQLFYGNADFLRFRDEATRAGIKAPIVPGIMPITRFSQIQRITSLCGAHIPDALSAALLRHEDGSPAQQAAGIEYTIEQCRELLDHGVPGLHVFTLNNNHATSRLVDALGSYFD
ncbi:MAG: methylenetetrahydrofolate reductase [NAD(P)H] [Anaerolineae bacterium]|nr:methylenetetrahydrofolate reductase [NAD(P)H] [Anaerolineae bacterium]MBK9234208.1 methylenetetrahydrofolate reductase [NAD(P)H] [Anaerolineae bacterium]